LCQIDNLGRRGEHNGAVGQLLIGPAAQPGIERV